MDFAPQIFLDSLQEGSIAQFVGNFLIVLVLFALIFFAGFRIGKRGLTALTAATYIGLVLYSVFPYTEELLAMLEGPLLTLLGILILAGAFIFLPYIILSRVLARDYSTSNHFITTGIVAGFLTSLLIASAYHLLGVPTYYDFTPALDAIFAPVQFFFWWFIAPLVALFFLLR